MPTSILFDFYSKPIVNSWLHLKTMIASEREDRKQRGPMSSFEIVATGAAPCRKIEKNEEPAFEIDPRIKTEWLRWNKRVW
jgi:hypothetical protein